MPLRGFCCIMLAMLKKVLLLAAAAACTFAAFAGCSNSENETNDNTVLGMRYYKSWPAFNTTAEFALYAPFTEQAEKDKAIATYEQAASLLNELESVLSVSVEGSDIYKFNTAAPGATVGISQHTYNVLKTARDMYEETEGAYNAGVYYSVDLWGFAPSLPGDESMPYDREHPNEQLPEDKYIEAFQKLGTHFPEIQLTDNGDGTYSVTKPEATVTVDGDETVYSLRIDLGGIGKGYAVELVDELIDEAGFENSYFSFGTSSMAINGSATSEDGKWELQIRDPRGQGLNDWYLSMRVANASLSTSGDYEQYYIIDGERYCHIIDPATGAPINRGIITATCIGGNAAEADARTTAICAMDLDTAIAYINSDEVKEQGLKLGFVYENKFGWKTFYTNMNEGDYILKLDNELPSWAYILIIIGAICIGCGIWCIVKHIKKSKSKQAEQVIEQSGSKVEVEEN